MTPYCEGDVTRLTFALHVLKKLAAGSCCVGPQGSGLTGTGVEELAGGMGGLAFGANTGGFTMLAVDETEIVLFRKGVTTLIMDETEAALIEGAVVMAGWYCGYTPVTLEVATGTPLRAPVFPKTPFVGTPVPAGEGPSDQPGAVLCFLAS